MIVRFSRSAAMMDRLPRGSEEEYAVEAEWFQLTYDQLRKAPDGEYVAQYREPLDAWFLLHGDAPNGPWSDAVFSEA